MVFRGGLVFGNAQGVRDRKLPERSLLRFMYATNGATSLGRDGIILTLPFFENPTIQETQRPRWTKHDLLGRNGQMFTFAGAQSRRVKLTFNLTLPHIMEDNKHPAIRYISGPDPKSDIRNAMRVSSGEGAGNPRSDGTGGPYSGQLPDAIEETVTEDHKNLHTYTDADIARPRSGAINLITWWVNVIRSATINNGRDPTLGPPIIMLRHGKLYQDTKFICESYSISFDEQAGYELRDLINRKIVVSMELAEIKIGDDYKPGDIERGDSITGWHDLMAYGIMDPKNDPQVLGKPVATEKSSFWPWADDVPLDPYNREFLNQQE